MQHSIFQIPVLSYHKIDTRYEFGVNVISPGKFQKQMQYLHSEGFSPINFHQLLNDKLPEKPIIITFDDGYECVFTHAIPILKKYNFTAVIFVITDFMGELNTWDANIGNIYFRHLNKTQIASLANDGFEIGSHTCSHKGLLNREISEIRAEFTESKNILQKITNNEIKTLAYPFGQNTADISKLALECGYQFGLVNIWGNGMAPDQFNLQRIPVYQIDSMAAFRAKLSPGIKQEIEFAKLHLISWPARLTPLYQRMKIKFNSKMSDQQICL